MPPRNNQNFLGIGTPGGFLGLNRVFQPRQFALTQASGSATDTPAADPIGDTANQIRDQFNEDVGLNQDILAGTSQAVQNIFNENITRILNDVPANPFNERLFRTLQSEQFDQITRDRQSVLQNLGNQAAARGLSSGGSIGTGARTNVDLEAIRNRQGATAGLREEQLRLNEDANRFRTGLLTAVTSDQARLEANLGIAQAAQRDPTFLAETFGDELSARLGKEQADALLDEMKKLADANDPTYFDIFGQLWEFVSTASGNPLQAGLGSVVSQLDDISL